MKKSFLWCIQLLVLLILLEMTGLSQQEKSLNPCPINADIWVLAGQSNMDGNGRTPDTLTNPQIMMLGLDNHWVLAKNPLHHIYDAVAPAYELTIMGFPWYREMEKEKVREELAKKRKESRIHPIGGVGPGIYFARHLLEQVGRPIGLIPCGIGGTTMEQWSPDRKPGGDSSLYGAMISRIKSTSNKIKGIIWYQGESEAMSGLTKNYENDLLHLISTIRKDVGDPDLPFIIVQIGCFNIHNSSMDKSFEEVREIQRKIINQKKNIYMISSIDLPLDDWVHVSTEGHKKLGKRIAEIALSYVYNLKNHAKQIDLESIKMRKDDMTGSNYLLLHFTGISGNLTCCGRPSQFELRVNGEPRYDYVVAKVEFDRDDPAGLKLFLSGLPNAPSQLVFGPATNPYMNITDSFDNAIPAFGPIDIPLK